MKLIKGEPAARFLDLGDGMVADLTQFHMRDVRHLVRRHDAVDDRGSVDCERLTPAQPFSNSDCSAVNDLFGTDQNDLEGTTIRTVIVQTPDATDDTVSTAL
jgi:hypothetical protein